MKKMKKVILRKFLLILAFLINGISAFAQGNQAIDEAAAEIAGYFDSVSNLVLMIGAIVGLVGGIRVYIKWNNGDQDVNKSIMGWFGSCIFLILVGVVIKAFFGL